MLLRRYLVDFTVEFPDPGEGDRVDDPVHDDECKGGGGHDEVLALQRNNVGSSMTLARLSHGQVISVHLKHHAGGETESQNKLPKKYGSYMKKSQ